MIAQHTHAVRVLRAACVFAFGMTACRPDDGDAALDPPVVRFREQEGAPGFGDVEVFPLNRRALSNMSASNPAAGDWQRVLAVHVGDTSGVAMLGVYSVSGDTLRFRPRFRPASGATYVARFDAHALQSPGAATAHGPGVITREWTHRVAAGPSTTVVTAVYPTTGAVPMNLLKMYVAFSAPMSTGRSYDFIRVYAEGDSLLEEPFFTAGGAVELWDPQRRRLTILFDPGRIKRDLKPHEERGLPLRAGKRYRLVIDSAWRDAQGRPLLRGYEKRFRVHQVDRSIVRTTDWRVIAPRAGTRDSLVLVFPEPLDRALLDRLLRVRDSAGVFVEGESAVSERETRWAFTPQSPWRSAPLYIEVDTELEDLAGNNLRRLFDVAPGDSAATGVTGTHARLRFVPR